MADPILYLAEGDSETAQSWSGCSHGLVTAFRGHGMHVRTVDVLPGPVGKWAAIALAFRPDRERWAARYHSGALGYALRSRRARAAARRHPAAAPIVQSGATFDLLPLTDRTVYLYCDANALFAARGRPHSSIAALSSRQFASVVERERRVYRRCAGIFTFSEAARRSFVDDFGVDPVRVTTVYAGSNLELVPADADVAVPRPGPPTIAFVGKAFGRKGGDDLLEAFRIVRARVPDARLIIAGAAPVVPADSGVEVLGYVDPRRTGPGSLYEVYRRADLFCMPSRYEPFGVVFVEAMLHAVPCVGTRAWAMPEIIEHGVTGWLAPPGDIEGLAAVLAGALADRTRLRQMGLAARRAALERFTWERVAGAMLKRISRGL